MYVEDAVTAYLTLAERAAEADIRGQAFNFGLGHPATALEVVETIIALSHCPQLKPIILNEVKHEIQDEYLCADKAQQLLGWQPSFTLDGGIVKTMAWYQNFLEQ